MYVKHSWGMEGTTCVKCPGYSNIPFMQPVSVETGSDQFTAQLGRELAGSGPHPQEGQSGDS